MALDSVNQRIRDLQAAVANVSGGSYIVGEFYFFRHPDLRSGFKPAQGGLLVNAATLYPEVWAYLQTTAGQKICKTEAQWQAMVNAVWGTAADGTTFGWNGIGGAPFYAPDTATGALRLPDLRGMYAEAAGFDALDVGATHGDAMRKIIASIAYVNTRGTTSQYNPTGAMFEPLNPGKDGGLSYSGGGTSWGRTGFDSSRVVPAANKNQPRAFGVLACVYLGWPAS